MSEWRQGFFEGFAALLVIDGIVSFLTRNFIPSWFCWSLSIALCGLSYLDEKRKLNKLNVIIAAVLTNLLFLLGYLIVVI